MIFSCYKYKSFHNENKLNWPIQPATIENWCDMVNRDQGYCNKKTFFKHVTFLFFLKIRKLKYSDLSSCHWYWREQIKLDLKKSLVILKNKYNECRRNPDRIKFIFNSNTSLKDIEMDIKSKELKLSK